MDIIFQGWSMRLAKTALGIISRRRGYGDPIEWQMPTPKWASTEYDGREWQSR